MVKIGTSGYIQAVQSMHVLNMSLIMQILFWEIK